MRVVFAVLLSLVLLFGAHFYTRFADSVRRQPKEIEVQFDDAAWNVQIERTFDCVPDPDYGNVESLVIQLKGVDVFRSKELIPASQLVSIGSVEGIEVGDNEIFLQANLAKLDDLDFDSERSNAMRVKLLRGKELVADETHWVSPGATSISQSIFFDVAQTYGDENHDDHDH